MNFDSYTHYVFDFDGTLFDTAPDVVHSLQKTLQHYGYATDAVHVSLQSWKKFWNTCAQQVRKKNEHTWCSIFVTTIGSAVLS